MTPAIIIALIQVCGPPTIQLVLKILADLKASGHPDHAEIPATTAKAISDVVKADPKYKLWAIPDLAQEPEGYG